MPNKNTKDMLGMGELYESTIGNLTTDAIGDATITSDTGPDEADGFDSHVPEMTNEKDVELKNQKKSEKLAKESINTFNTNAMNNKTTDTDNIFDKLYQSLMESEDLPTMDDDPFGSDDSGDELSMGDEGGDTITLELERDVAEKLHKAIGELLDVGDDTELEELPGEGDDDPFASGGEDDPFQDAIEVVADPKPLPETNLKSGNNSSMDNKPKAAGYHGKGGKATSGKIPEVVADPKNLPETNHKSGNNSKHASDKVHSPGTNQGELIK